MKAIIILSVFASMASMILSRQIQVLPAALGEEESPVADISDLPDETKQVILNYVAEKMDEAFPNLYHEVQTRANLFNLSAYLNTNRPANGTALTFVPLITLLSGILGG